MLVEGNSCCLHSSGGWEGQHGGSSKGAYIVGGGGAVFLMWQQGVACPHSGSRVAHIVAAVGLSRCSHSKGHETLV